MPAEAHSVVDQLTSLLCQGSWRDSLNRWRHGSASFSDLDWKSWMKSRKSFEIVQSRSLALGWKRKLLYLPLMGWMWLSSLGQDISKTDSYCDSKWRKTKRIRNIIESWALKWKFSPIPTSRSRREPGSTFWRECPPKSWNDCRAGGKQSSGVICLRGGYLGRRLTGVGQWSGEWKELHRCALVVTVGDEHPNSDWTK